MSNSGNYNCQNDYEYPIRKELIKRFISYYHMLEEDEVLAIKLGCHKSIFPEVDFDPDRTYMQFDQDLRSYNDVVARRSKIEELRSLMKYELGLI